MPQPPLQLISDLLERARHEHPRDVAVVSAAGDWTFEELAGHCDRVAAALLHHGVHPGDHVALVMDNSPLAVAGFFGILRAGAVLVPLNTRLTTSEIAYEIDRADITAVLVLDRMLPLLGDVRILRQVVVVPTPGEHPDLPGLAGGVRPVLAGLDRDATGLPAVTADPDDVAIMWFTSGTTGRPKPTMHSHAGTIAAMAAWATAFGLGPGDRMANQNLYHVATVSFMCAPLHAGAAVVLVGPFSLENRLAEIERFGVTAEINGIVFLSLLDHHPGLAGRYSLGSLRKLGWGGAPMTTAMLDRTIERFSWIDQWYLCWAQTESGSGGTCLTGDAFFSQPNSIGRPIGCVDEIAVIRPDGADRDDANGDGAGELVMRGPTVMKGYYRDEESTRATVQDGWLRTGDLASVNADGYVFLRGRSRDTIKRGGENVLPADVERVLSEFPAVGSCAVVGLPDSVMTEVPIAFVIPQEGRTVDLAALNEHLARQLADFKRPVHVLTVDEFPRNSNGKIIRQALIDSARHLAR